MARRKALTYRQAGVDIGAAEATVRLFQAGIRATRTEVINGIGDFYGSFRLPDGTTLVAGADGVGTKVLVASETGRFDTIGMDLVAMNVNDILTAGAEPLFFLDYVAVGHLDPDQVLDVVSGVDRGCLEAGCALLGGETAEMPGLYQPGHLDLAGFAVGRVITDRMPSPPVSPGLRVLGIGSSGLHANGFSLVRRIVSQSGIAWTDRLPGTDKTWGDAVLCPTRIYVRPVLDAIRANPVAAMAHITGGGLVGNLPRALGGLGARLDQSRWTPPPVMQALQRLGAVDDQEMARVFNLGIGFCLMVPPDSVDALIRYFSDQDWFAADIGEVVKEPGVSFQ